LAPVIALPKNEYFVGNRQYRRNSETSLNMEQSTLFASKLATPNLTMYTKNYGFSMLKKKSKTNSESDKNWYCESPHFEYTREKIGALIGVSREQG
jgi:hypothetical protein